MLNYIHVFAQVDHVSTDKFYIQNNGHSLKIPFYSSQDIFVSDDNIKRVIVVLHGNTREAQDHFSNMESVVESASMSEGTLIVSPQLLTEEDVDFHSLDNEHLYWTSGGWKAGSNSRDESSNSRPFRIPSYAVMDSLFFHLANQFHNVSSIVFAGHSAGGQVTQRYAASSPLADILCNSFDITMQFIVSNPSSYLYMDNQRAVPGTINEFEIPTTNCSGYNEWKFGLVDLYTYPETIGADSIRNMYKRRNVTYLMGQEDNDPNSSSLDVTCKAMLQGSHRFERAQTFYNYLQHYYGNSVLETHEFLTVPNVDHNSFEMYNSALGHYALFEKTVSQGCGTILSSMNIEKEDDLLIYPNPATDFLNILMSTTSNEQISILVFDTFGKMILSDKLIQSQSKLDVSAFKHGLYFIMVEHNNTYICKKILVE